ncbi:phosphoglycerate kinase, partial [Candidatus Kaiserbacteria bacterium]
MKYIDERNDLEGKVVLVRSGLNVPVQNGAVQNDFRIRKALPTLKFLIDQGAKIVIIAHIGRDKGDTLHPVSVEMGKHIDLSFMRRSELDTEKMNNGDVILLENLRQDYRETHNHDSLSEDFASMTDIFVQDAFEVCHREHASVVGIPKFMESYGGLLLKEEVETLSNALTPEHPALFILGGAKLATKKPLVEKFLEIYDSIFLGGTLQNEILAAKGFNIGKSVVEDGEVEQNILENHKVQDVIDVLVESSEGVVSTVSVNEVKDGDRIVDMGSGTTEIVSKSLSSYKTILWNGPLGWYERGFDAATVTIARAISKSGAKTIIGGGDTVAVVQKEGLEGEFDFVSTGGGAMLKFLQ